LEDFPSEERLKHNIESSLRNKLDILSSNNRRLTRENDEKLPSARRGEPSMEMSFIASFWLVSFLLIITPGADWAYTISAGINGRRVIPAVAGLMSGHLLATLIVIAGIGVLIANHPLALSTLTLLGAGYLMWLGIAILRHPPTPGPAAQRGQLESLGD
jgi:hypothetical protein